MASGVTKRVEDWTRKTRDGGTPTNPIVKTVVAHRWPDGRFHGATNHRMRGDL